MNNVRCHACKEPCTDFSKSCIVCMAERVMWRRIEDYIISCNYTWTYEGLKHDYQNYYMKGAYCSHTFLDIVKHNEAECKFLFCEVKS